MVVNLKAMLGYASVVVNTKQMKKEAYWTTFSPF